MNTRASLLSLHAVATAALMGFTGTLPLWAQATPIQGHRAAGVEPAIVRLTLDDAKQRALSSSKLLALASMNAQGKQYAIKAARADYLPQMQGASFYFHFDNPLGTVVTSKGTITGTPLNVAVNVLNQDSSLSTIYAAQPVTALLKVRQEVKIAQADKQIAQAELEKGTRELLSGVEQLFWGLLAAQRIRGGAAAAVAGATELVKAKSPDAQTTLLEAKQALQAVDNQVADVEQQLRNLLDLPPCTKIELVEPPFPIPPCGCVDEAIDLAIQSSPEIRQAEQDIVKARAAVAAAKVDYLPNVAVIGGYAKQTGASYIQQDINYVGVTGTYTFFAWGKRRNTVKERENLVSLAQLKVDQTRDEVRQKALKAFREFEQDRVVLQNAEEMVKLRTEAERNAPAAAKFAAARARMQAEVDYVKADLAYRVAYVQLMSLIAKP